MDRLVAVRIVNRSGIETGAWRAELIRISPVLLIGWVAIDAHGSFGHRPDGAVHGRSSRDGSILVANIPSCRQIDAEKLSIMSGSGAGIVCETVEEAIGQVDLLSKANARRGFLNPSLLEICRDLCIG